MSVFCQKRPISKSNYDNNNISNKFIGYKNNK